MPNFDTSASKEASRLGVHRTTIISAIRAGLCGGEERNGYWYTSSAEAAKWYKNHYRHADALYSKSAGKSWTKDLPRMMEMLAAGKSVEDVASALKRSVNAVKIKACKEGIRPRKAEKFAHARERIAPEILAQARAAIIEDNRAQPLDWYKQRRQDERDGRLRIHVAPEVKQKLAAGLAQINAQLPDGTRVTMAQFLSWAGLAALEDETILERGRELASRIR